MKASFYFVLCILSCLLLDLLNIPFLHNEYIGFFACIIVFFAHLIIRKLLKNSIEYQKMCEAAFILEMAYNNDYKKYKQQAQIKMTIHTVGFVCMLLLFIALFTSSSNTSLIDYILFGAFAILTGINSALHIWSYLKIRKEKHIILNEELQEKYLIYKNKRDTCTYEEMLLPRPRFYLAINAANTIFAIMTIVIGLLMCVILYTNKEEFDLISIGGLSLCGILALYYGVTDLLCTSNSQKYILLLLSCIIAALLYMPITNYRNKASLEAYIANDPDLSYNAKNNIVQETIILDEISETKVTYWKQRLMIILSRNYEKEMLKKVIKIGAEFQYIFKDKSGNKKVVTISPSELKKIYNQTRSNLDILLESIKLDFDDAKVYDDGECITIELIEDIPYPIQPEETKKLIKDFTRECAEIYDVKESNRGIKIRCIYKNQQFIEYTLSLDELRKIEDKTALDKSGKYSNSLFNLD